MVQQAIGVSNFSIEQLKHLMKHCRVLPCVNQVIGLVVADNRTSFLWTIITYLGGVPSASI